MDHHYHHRWCPPPAQGSICPVCSISHFPFCPPLPPPSFNPSPGFPPQPLGYHGHGCGPVAAHPSHGQYPSQPDPRNSYGYGNYGSDPYGQYPNQFHQECHAPRPCGYASSNGYAGEGERSYKKMRVEESDSSVGGYGNEDRQSSLMVSSDDERRLKLIRDHGNSGIGLPSEVKAGPNSEMNGFSWDNMGFDDFRGGRGELSTRNSEMSRYGNAAVTSLNTNVQFVPREDDRFGIENKYMQKSGNGFQTEATGMKRLYHDQSGGISRDNNGPNYRPLTQQYGIQSVHEQNGFKQAEVNGSKLPFPGNQGSMGYQKFPGVAQYGAPSFDLGGSYPPHAGGTTMNVTRPPLPPSPPPPLPIDPSGYNSSERETYSLSPPTPASSLFPVSSSRVTPPFSSAPGSHNPQAYYQRGQTPNMSVGFVPGEYQGMQGNQSKPYGIDGHLLPLKPLPPQKPKLVNASHIFKPPHRAARPDHFVVILRGLPGSGKSYLAKMLRDLELDNGGNAPRIYSIDDYFMTEVEKVEDSDAPKSSSLVKGKKPAMKKMMEYCYEPEMEEAYRSSMLKAYKKTVEEGVFTFIIVDDRNLRVADFAQFWAIGKTSGYEVYVLEATYKDPEGCAARNVHGFTLDDIQKMAGQWEELPALYLQLDVKSIFHGDDLKESGIQEVDMDMEDDPVESLPTVEGKKLEKPMEPTSEEALSRDGERWDADGDHTTEQVRELGRSKWSDDLEELEKGENVDVKSSMTVLSGLSRAYDKKRKSVRWGDQVGNTGFSIGAAKKANIASLVIGPGAGYNVKSNPLQDQNLIHGIGEPKKKGIFQERIRAEHESFKAVFDRRRHRIGGLNFEDE